MWCFSSLWLDFNKSAAPFSHDGLVDEVETVYGTNADNDNGIGILRPRQLLHRVPAKNLGDSQAVCLTICNCNIILSSHQLLNHAMRNIEMVESAFPYHPCKQANICRFHAFFTFWKTNTGAPTSILPALPMWSSTRWSPSASQCWGGRGSHSSISAGQGSTPHRELTMYVILIPRTYIKRWRALFWRLNIALYIRN